MNEHSVGECKRKQERDRSVEVHNSVRPGLGRVKQCLHVRTVAVVDVHVPCGRHGDAIAQGQESVSVKWVVVSGV